MFKSKLEAMIVVLLLLVIPPCSLAIANNLHPTKAEVATSGKP
jgi:hypothetical protein